VLARRVEHGPVAELELGDADAGELPHEREPLLCFRRNRARHPAVAVAEEGQKERPALVDLFEAEADHLFVLRLVFGDTPAQVDIVQLDAVRQQLLAQRRERHLDQVIAFRVHVSERRGDEDTDGFPGGGHTRLMSASLRFPVSRRLHLPHAICF
jgi:hypothetical protein